MLPLTALVALGVAAGAPAVGEERGAVEVGVAAEVLYPPAVKDPRSHPTYGAVVSGSITTEGSFKAMIGFGFDHVVNGWLGSPAAPDHPRDGPFRGTLPTSFRGQLFRMTPVVRVGIENDFAYGYFGASPGYTLRVAKLTCVAGPCSAKRAVDHALNLGLSLGAMLYPLPDYGLIVGGEVALDWAWFPRGHPSLAAWSQGMSARLIAGWRF